MESLVRFGRKAMEKRKELFKTYLVPHFSFSFIKKIKTTQHAGSSSPFKNAPQLIRSVKDTSLGQILSHLVS